jgi:DNA polymerase III subunit epsilon
LPAHLPADFADDLPEAPGAYRLFGEDDALLYVGRGHALRTRVLAQLAGSEGDSGQRRFARLVRRIDWVETAGELGAMLCEAEWIKTQKPPYNRRIKSQAHSYTLRGGAVPAAEGRPRPLEAAAIDGVDAADLEQCFGVFHSEKDARKALSDIARAHQLCLKVLGLEDGAGSCFAFQVGRCKGACVGKEPLLLHDLRLRLALSSLKLKPWPFPGRIALRERAARSGEFQGARGPDLHVMDHWTYLGTARTDEELAALRAKPACAGFDPDLYKVLVRYFSSHPKLDWIDLRDEPPRGCQRPYGRVQ